MTDSFAARFGRRFRQAEDGLLTVLVALLVVMAGLQIVLRLFFDTGIAWADALLRTLVLWTALFGAMTAAREDKHLAVDALSRFLPRSALRFTRVLTHGIAAAICVAMAFYTFKLVQLEFDGDAKAFGKVPSWIAESIMPIAFTVMGLRFVRQALRVPAPHAPAAMPALDASDEKGR
jgi:TRAP-type C4-dicarboxylate transport system permease small subunit